MINRVSVVIVGPYIDRYLLTTVSLPYADLCVIKMNICTSNMIIYNRISSVKYAC